MGTRSSGTALVHASGPPTSLPANSYAVPILDGQLVFDALIKTAPNTADPAAPDTTVSAGGVSVPIRSAVAGAQVNLPSGTVLRWDPPIQGVEPTSSIEAPGLAGGSHATFFGSAKQIAMYESLGAATAASDLFAAKVGRFPAFVLRWEGKDQVGETVRVGRGRTLFRHNWVLAIVTSRSDSQESRAAEGLELLEGAMALLSDRCDLDGEVFSAPEPIVVKSGVRVSTTPSSY